MNELLQLIEQNAPVNHGWNRETQGKMHNADIGDFNIDFVLCDKYNEKKDRHTTYCEIYMILDEGGELVNIDHETERKLADYITKKCFEF